MFKSKATINLWAECGDDYYFGRDGETIDYEMALIFYQKAAKKKHPHACYMIGVCRENGHGIKKDRAVAKDWYERAAKYGDENAKKRLAEGKLDHDDLEYSPRVMKYLEKEAENKDFWLQTAAKNRKVAQLLKKLSLPVKESGQDLTYEDLNSALREKRKEGLFYDNDYSVLTLALLLIKVKRGSAALFDRDIVRAYLTDFLPQINEMRRLSAFVFDTDAIDFLRNEPEKALNKLKARGISPYEAEQLIECFAAAFAVTVDYEGLANEALLNCAEYGDARAMFILACRYFGGEGPTDDENNNKHYRYYLQKAIDLGHGPAVALSEMSAMFDDED